MDVDPRSNPETVDGVRDGWFDVEQAWRSTFARARRLPEVVLHERVNGEWSFVETQRHLLFATDVWIRRSVLDAPAAYHSLGMPPDLRTGQPDPDHAFALREWGIDLWATPSLEEVLDARADYMGLVRHVVQDLTTEELHRTARHNPPWIHATVALPMSRCFGVVIREEWEHHKFATRDLTILEQQR